MGLLKVTSVVAGSECRLYLMERLNWNGETNECFLERAHEKKDSGRADGILQ